MHGKHAEQLFFFSKSKHTNSKGKEKEKEKGEEQEWELRKEQDRYDSDCEKTKTISQGGILQWRCCSHAKRRASQGGAEKGPYSARTQIANHTAAAGTDVAHSRQALERGLAEAP